MGAADSADDAEQTSEAATSAPVRKAAPQQQPVEAVEQRTHAPSGRLSADTLKALLLLQEKSGPGER